MKQLTRNNQSFNLTDNAQCRCFDKPKTEEHYFLVKNKYPKDINPSTYNKVQHNTSNEDFRHRNSKKSLKKQKSREYQKQQPDKIKHTYQEYYPVARNQQRTERVDFRPQPLQIKQRGVQYRNTFAQNIAHRNQFQGISPLLIKSASAQYIPAPYTQRIIPPLPINAMQFNQPRILSPQISPRMYASSEKIMYQPAPLTPRYKMQGLISTYVKPRQEMRTEAHTIQKIQSEKQFNIKIPEKKKIVEMKVLSDRTMRSKVFDLKPKEKEPQLNFEQMKKKPQQQISYYKEQVLKPSIMQQQIKSKIFFDKNRLNIPSFQSRIDTKKSYLDDGTGKSKITLRKAKNLKPRLNKMDDVQEIKSMIDSEEMRSDDDNQSIVLAKLNEYGSLVDPTFSAVESRPITFMSKVAYQSTTAEKSMVKAYQYNYK